MLLCHIVGLNNVIKKDFIEMCENNIDKKIIVEDIDDISKIIMNDDKYLKLLDQYNDPISIGRRKEILHELSIIWKNIMVKEIQNILESNNDSCVILLGLSNYVMDHRIKIDMPTKNLFFVNIDPIINAKQIIDFNLDKFREHIIDGKFPLSYLNLSFLIEQREELRDLYIAKGYLLKHYDALIRWIESKGCSSAIERVYVASFMRHDDHIDYITNGVGYSTKWMAISALFPKTSIKRALLYDNKTMIPHLTEIVPNAFNAMRKPAYIYDFFPKKQIDDLRYLVSSNSFEKREYISNIYDELLRLGVRMESYKIINDTESINL